MEAVATNPFTRRTGLRTYRLSRSFAGRTTGEVTAATHDVLPRLCGGFPLEEQKRMWRPAKGNSHLHV